MTLTSMSWWFCDVRRIFLRSMTLRPNSSDASISDTSPQLSQSMKFEHSNVEYLPRFRSFTM
jgi:hypothetical protein